MPERKVVVLRYGDWGLVGGGSSAAAGAAFRGAMMVAAGVEEGVDVGVSSCGGAHDAGMGRDEMWEGTRRKGLVSVVVLGRGSAAVGIEVHLRTIRVVRVFVHADTGSAAATGSPVLDQRSPSCSELPWQFFQDIGSGPDHRA